MLRRAKNFTKRKKQGVEEDRGNIGNVLELLSPTLVEMNFPQSLRANARPHIFDQKKTK